MTVYELIQALAYYPPNQEVVCKVNNSSTLHGIDYVADKKYIQGENYEVIIEVADG